MTETGRNNIMYKKKQNEFKSPDLSRLQEVVIDLKTKIYIAPGDDPVMAKKRYLARHVSK
ncbi:MAG: hypothetical protein JXA03_07030 [Bacteroidales bacterium]|nr:hypothetical protein [Bacteroidales bacterium]